MLVIRVAEMGLQPTPSRVLGAIMKPTEHEKRCANLEKENERLRSSIEGYRRDIDNCLAALRHKNRVLRDRDIEHDRVCSERDRAIAASAKTHV